MRYRVIVFAVAVIQSIDRVCISHAAPAISKDLGLTPKQMGYIFSAFTVAYALFEIPTGWLGHILSLTDSTTQDGQLAFSIFAAMYFLGAICWLLIDPVTLLEEEGKAARMSQNRGS